MHSTLQDQLLQLNRLYKESNEVFRSIAQELSLTDTAFWILFTVSHFEEAVSQQELSSLLFYPAQTINSAVTRLKERDYIRLEPIPSTKNRKRLILTEKGEKLSREVFSRIDTVEEEALRQFSEEERHTYLTLYRRHLDALKKGEEALRLELSAHREDYT